MSGDSERFDTNIIAYLSDAVSSLSVNSQIEIVFNIVLGRDPSTEDLSYYTRLSTKSTHGIRDVIREVSSSTEAQMRGLGGIFVEASTLGGSGDITSPLFALVSIGRLYRKLSNQAERFSNLEELAKLTLLTVPALSERRQKVLSDRVAKLEQLIASIEFAPGED